MSEDDKEASGAVPVGGGRDSRVLGSRKVEDGSPPNVLAGGIVLGLEFLSAVIGSPRGGKDPEGRRS